MGVCTFLNYVWLGWLCYSEVCYEDIGCFDNWPPFDNADYELPDSPDAIKVSFLLYTVNNINISQPLTTIASEISRTNYQGSKGTVFLTHGYEDGPDDAWILAAINAILGQADVNVVVVDWQKGANTQGNYFKAAANTRVVGALTAHLMTSLFTSAGAKYEDMYIIGFSLGAHVAGYAGQRVPNLGRITGLDPAYWAFSQDEPAVRLDTTDATFVDIIHTDGIKWFWGISWGFGIPDSIGHADYFPNGGLDQPGCETLLGLVAQSSCDHARATEYFVESIDSACSFTAVPCESWTNFRERQCSCDTDCSQMGFFTRQAEVSGNYYLKTNSQSPFCIT